MESCLIILFIIFFFFSFRYFFKMNDLVALAYFGLFLYTIFTMIGYLAYPDIAKAKSLYFGKDIWYYYYYFITVSFVLSFLLYRILASCRFTFFSLELHAKRSCLSTQFYYIVAIALCFGAVAILILWSDRFSYRNKSQTGFDLLLNYWISCVGFLGMLSWMKFRTAARGRNFARLIDLVIMVISLAIFSYLEMHNGTRSPILYVGIGMFVFEAAPLYKTIKKRPYFFLAICIISAPVIIFLVAMTYARYIYGSPTFMQTVSLLGDVIAVSHSDGLGELIFDQDYFYPSLLLFKVINDGFINPGQYIISNLANSLIMVKYPLLSQVVVQDLYGDLPRAVGFAYHLFIDGYIVFGVFGVFINAIIWNIYMRLWSWFCSTNDMGFNRAMLAFLCTRVINGMRGQSQGMIKLLWFEIVPAVLLLLLAYGLRLTIVKRNIKTFG